MAKDPSIEAKLIENPDDAAQALVYADFLQSKGDPRGTLISLQHAGKQAEADALLEQHADVFLGPLTTYKTTLDGLDTNGFEWRRGFIRKATLSFDAYASEDADVPEGTQLSLETALAELLQHPSGALLEELVLPINMLEDGGYFSPLVSTLSKFGAPALRKLRIGMFSCSGGPGGEGDYEYEISWTGIGDAGGLWSALPRLERLVIQSGLGNSSVDNSVRDGLGTIRHDKLKHFQVITGGLSIECLQSIANADLPALEFLEVWTGSANYGAGGGVDDLAPLFAGTKFPKLKSLGLCNSEFSDDLAKALTKAPIVAQLETLSLRYGTLSDEGASALLAIPNLKKLTLDVRNNYLTEPMVEKLKAAGGTVLADSQRGEAGDRYVSLSE